MRVEFRQYKRRFCFIEFNKGTGNLLIAHNKRFKCQLKSMAKATVGDLVGDLNFILFFFKKMDVNH